MSDTYTVSRSVTVDASPADVYAHIVDFHRWAAWSPWDQMDPNMERTFSGSEVGTGARYGWSGNRKVGVGSMEITEVVPDERVEIALEFVKPFKASNATGFTLEPEGSGTRVTWSMSGRTTLMTKLMGLFKSMDDMVGPDFERGLAALKQVVEGR